MAVDLIEAVQALLVATEVAHGTYEATALNGVFDREWAQWYAAFAVDHGLGQLVGHIVTAERLAEFLASAYVVYERTPPESREPWAAYTARRIAGEL